VEFGMEKEIVSALIGSAGTALVAVAGFYWNYVVNKQHLAREDILRSENQENERRRAAMTRRMIPRADVDVDCHFYGPQQGEYLVELLVKVHNVGETQRRYSSMKIRLLGMARNEAITLRPDKRVEFPYALLKTDFVPPPDDVEHYYYVEPGVRQDFTFITKIPSHIAFVLYHIKLKSIINADCGDGGKENAYENEYTEEKIFAVPEPPAEQGASGSSAVTDVRKVASSRSL
jgi:hypothetical protein